MSRNEHVDIFSSQDGVCCLWWWFCVVHVALMILSDEYVSISQHSLRIISSIRWPWLPLQGCRSPCHSFLSPLQSTHITLWVDTCGGWRKNNLPSLSSPVVKVIKCATWVPLSAGLDVAQIAKLDVKCSRGWQELREDVFEFIFHGVNESWKCCITLPQISVYRRDMHQEVRCCSFNR